RAPRLLLTVATIGLSQLLLLCGVMLPRWWGNEVFDVRTLPDPIPGSFELGRVRFPGSEILALVPAPLLPAALAIVLRRTDLGIAVRASAERSDRAALLGVPVRRLQTLVWATASVLSFVGLFLHASVFGYGGAMTMSPQALVFALTALVLGK